MASHRRTAVDARRRALSQNLLHDPSVAHRLAAASGAGPGDLVLEPGPGRGAVTRALAARGFRVLAYELDPLLARDLDAPGVTVRRGDFRAAPDPGEPFHVAGNIPFAATAGIVAWCLDAPNLRTAALITQLEYARKRAGHYRRWTRLTVLTWPWFEWRHPGVIGRDAFRPRPSVDAGLLTLTRRARPLVPPGRAGAWRQAVETGFTGVGGSLAASLATVHSRRGVRAAFAAAGADPWLPVGLVPPETWLAVFGRL
ncbi:23S rRNA (adenine(2058)-N(6))-methyltransferase Erm(O) [Actinorhabdospora filicis]|uniref:23S rRNA (Adenine(2058)-N(6))-methyltransferase Erm(O) n=1 Tax=Actinorhabdospora filicis TaxID=1785913 RepID=A0A9W6WCY6_9ACTN|nr:rRNA adenine N(6)-methyltransferase family protein [Actinorhabdospora filicis]GLZ81563.1 23S rRNA (adenine(2058)-N(6))-methyltransferase Erm(O) [Actinorhabdospora filicis]